ncbi:unnamed protein product [Bursaphelenchus okinawaensis]|uniref:Uncharacterized protein n=1 Tax=Bursaphelenchus okinawaensis TaxID=465554 RepID=A0A811K0L5_9BILA|nr:unnamed protein product [Bursaphelenchus okinawaensis]CAG9089280.1 unnamed protein product [Bursaphelenchus okinawaensis]
MGNVFSIICPCMRICKTEGRKKQLSTEKATEYFICYYLQKPRPAISDYVLKGKNDDKGVSQPEIELGIEELSRTIDAADQKLANDCVFERLICFGEGPLKHIFSIYCWNDLTALKILDDQLKAKSVVICLATHAEATQYLVSKKNPKIFKSLPPNLNNFLGALTEAELTIGVPDVTKEPFMESSTKTLKKLTLYSHQLTEEFARSLELNKMTCEMTNDDNEKNLMLVNTKEMYLNYKRMDFGDTKLFRIHETSNPFVTYLQVSWPMTDQDCRLDSILSLIQSMKDAKQLTKFVVTNSAERKFEIIGNMWIPSVDRWPEVGLTLDFMRQNFLNRPKVAKGVKFEFWFSEKFVDKANNIALNVLYIVRGRKLFLELVEPKQNVRLPTRRNLRSMNNLEIIHYTKSRIIQYYKMCCCCHQK